MIRVQWLFRKQADPPDDDEWLTWRERTHLGELRFPKRRAEWRLGRWTAKSAVVLHLNEPERPDHLRAIELRAAADGAPEVFVHSRPAPVVISLSHRGGLALCTVAPAGALLGCDLEVVEPRSDAFVEDYFTEEERAVVAAAPLPTRSLLAPLIWSAKESALKALRTGLQLDTRQVEVTLSQHGEVAGWWPLAVRHAATGRRFHGWWRREGRYLITVAAEPEPRVPEGLEAG